MTKPRSRGALFLLGSPPPLSACDANDDDANGGGASPSDGGANGGGASDGPTGPAAASSDRPRLARPMRAARLASAEPRFAPERPAPAARHWQRRQAPQLPRPFRSRVSKQSEDPSKILPSRGEQGKRASPCADERALNRTAITRLESSNVLKRASQRHMFVTPLQTLPPAPASRGCASRPASRG
jgi:hypothetical protein